MIRFERKNLKLAAAAAGLIVIGGAAGLALARFGPGNADPVAASAGEREVLYWYDPMTPGQRFDKPGKSPFMDMELLPRYADEESGAAAGVRIDPALVQNLGVRFATVRSGTLDGDLTASAVVDYNERDVAIVQARASGFVQRVYARAPGDVIAAGVPLADLLVPDWGGAQIEYLAVRGTDDAALILAARQRLVLLGMPESLIVAVERTGRPRTTVTMTSPISGAIRTLGVRAGMSVPAGLTLAEINGLSTVWLNAAVPEALAGQLRVGRSVDVSLAAFPGERMTGRLTALLPEVTGDSRTLTARVELRNPGGRLRPGMYGQITFGGSSTPALLVPSEAVIRTGQRNLVMLAMEGGRYQPAEVRVGREAGGQTEILAGLRDGERVVASGQFLFDSEASLSGVTARSLAQAAAPSATTAPAPAQIYRTSGRVQAIDGRSITLAHGPVPALQWPAMTMTFTVADAVPLAGISAGSQVDFGFDMVDGKATIRSLTRREAGR
ncbi:efflux RND transporter periplasmic adaptor subunit [uncultured Brevundimonas sp.]|jgi:membrane fusion protein, copper/silver efflux system|uniref:efflux RND transporter periplasmic adaptor subunit n=1 Tax=uncultured Brevundimonas sp. TaxID=213418 RepID=UPI0030EC740C|tara:strand:+ start:8872 stop:10365 length:1494 start_codon:yes stop_codon:yes gene_type:complete